MISFENNSALRAIKFVIWDVALDFVRMPVWWYTGGLRLAGRGLWNAWREMEKRLSLGVWLKHLFVPMYGYRDWQSRLISFFVRLVLLVAKLFVVLVWSVILIVLFGAWLILPAVVVWMIIYNFAVF